MEWTCNACRSIFGKESIVAVQKILPPCLRCYECFGETGTSETKCSVNPDDGQQLPEKYGRPEPEMKKRVLIVGGGPAGTGGAYRSKRSSGNFWQKRQIGSEEICTPHPHHISKKILRISVK